jgi:PKD repeat protein
MGNLNKHLILVVFLLFGFGAASAQTITVGTVDAGPYGQGSTITAQIHVDNTSGCIAVNNIYTLYLSDEFGSFTNKKAIGTFTGFYATFVNGIIPRGQAPGSSYRLRVESSSPVVISSPSNPFNISAAEGVVASTASQIIDINSPEVFGVCVADPTHPSLPFDFNNTSTAGATANANFFNELTQVTQGTKTLPTTFAADFTNYTVVVTAKKDLIVGTKSYTLINNTVYRNFGGVGDNTYCVGANTPATFNIAIDANQNGVNSGLKYNYPGLTYKVSFGDGTSQNYRYCDLASQNGNILHSYNKSSCGNSVNGQNNVFKVDFTAVNAYCTGTATTTAYAKILNPPKNSFTIAKNACTGQPVTFSNTSDPGQDANNTGLECKNASALYTWTVTNVNVPGQSQNFPSFTLNKPFVYTFPAHGSYVVSLNVQDNRSCEALSALDTICVQDAPKPDFTLPVHTGCFPLQVTPVNTSVIDNTCSNTDTFLWTVTGPAPVKFLGGTSSISQTPQFSFETAGVYYVKLNVKSAGCDSPPKIDSIVVDNAPTAILSPNITLCGINQMLTFNGDQGPTQSTISGSSKPKQGDYVWTITGDAQFVGGTDKYSRYPQILFPSAADYTITVTAQSQCGTSATASQTISFKDAPLIDAGTSPPVCEGNIVTLKGTAGTVKSVLWTGGNGTFSNPTSLITTYTPTAAEYAAGSVTLTLTGTTNLSGACAQIPSNITVNFQAANHITSSDKAQICSGFGLGYNITAVQPGTTFSWTVDVANTSPSISGYAASGTGSIINDVLKNSDLKNSGVITYNIIATNGICSTPAFVLKVSLSPKAAVASFTKDIIESCGNTSVQFTNTSAPLDGSTFVWDFGDNGPTSSDINPLHIFKPNADGSDAVYNVKLTINSLCGSATSEVQTITIRPTIPVASINPQVLTACIPVSLKVYNTSPGTNKSYHYYLYNDLDKKLVQDLVVTTIDPVDFKPIEQSGNYTLYMVAEGFCGTKGESVHIPLKIDAKLLQAQIFATGPTEGCDGSFVAHIFNNSTPGNTYTYNIKNSNGEDFAPKPGALGDFQYEFAKPGIYYVTMTVNNSCNISKPSNQLMFIVHSKPLPNFTVASASACGTLTAKFTNTTPPDATTQASSMKYLWDFGDGSPTSTDFNPAPHVYAARSTPYTVTLTATVPLTGCTDIITKTNFISVTSPPGANFDVKPGLVVSLPNYHFEFVDKTTGTPNKWEWDFGDGGTSSSQNANHTYSDTGKYKVTLRVVDVKGCDNIYAQTIQITGIPGQLYVPNAFEPNNGNTELKIFSAKGSGIQSWRMQVFNKWGQLVWETNKLSGTGEPMEGWDGNFKGVPSPQGTYIWQATAKFINGSEWKGMSYHGSLPSRSGAIYLIR